jgi:protein-S-isoprenylcysteine O-methyltransferase Ste14
MATLAPAQAAAGRNAGLAGRAQVLDLIERAVVLALFVAFVARNYAAVVDKGQWFNAIMVASEALVVLFVMIRRSGEASVSAGDWALAFAATAGPLLARASAPGHGLIPAGSGAAILLFGFAIQVWSKLTLRRSFGIVPANRGVKASGPYRFVRHPMYLGYVTVHIGFLLLLPNLWNLAVYGLSFAVQLFRILAEERLLGRDPAYAAFVQKTRYRLLPGVF